MENKTLEEIYQNLQKLLGLHRQLLETVRFEHEALVNANLKEIQDQTTAKQALIEAITQCESKRLRAMGELSLAWKKPLKDLTLSNVIIAIQGKDLKSAELFRSCLNAITFLTQRITVQNNENKALVEKSLEHIHQMKQNVMGESVPAANTYTPHGQKTNNAQGARFISQEA